MSKQPVPKTTGTKPKQVIHMKLNSVLHSKSLSDILWLPITILIIFVGPEVFKWNLMNQLNLEADCFDAVDRASGTDQRNYYFINLNK